MNPRDQYTKWPPAGSSPHRRAARDAACSRRGFLKGMAATSAGLLVAPGALRAGGAPGGRETSRIVRVHHPGATSGIDVLPEPVDQMVHAAVRELTGIAHTGNAWKSLFPGITAARRVGIKINLSCGDVPTHPEVVNAIVDGLLMMDLDGEQLPAEHITVWDDTNSFFCAQTGYTVNYGGAGVQYYGTDHAGVGYDMAYTCDLTHPLGIHTYHHPSKIITQKSDYMINAAVIKDHSDAGVTLCLKNNYGSFDGVASIHLHQGWNGDGHTRGEPGLNAYLRDQLGDKTRLFLVDATLGLYTGGPGYTPPGHTPPNWACNSLLVGLDPVAIDRIGTIKINEERAAHSLATLDPSHIAVAAAPPYSLGTDDPAQIELIELELGGQIVSDPPPIDGAVALLAPYPNPSREAVTLRFHVRTESDVELIVVDAAGSVVRRLAAGRFAPGQHRLRWDGRDGGGRLAPNGVYFCRLGGGGRLSGEARLLLAR